MKEAIQTTTSRPTIEPTAESAIPPTQPTTSESNSPNRNLILRSRVRARHKPKEQLLGVINRQQATVALPNIKVHFRQSRAIDPVRLRLLIQIMIRRRSRRLMELSFVQTSLHPAIETSFAKISMTRGQAGVDDSCRAAYQ